VTTSGPAPKPAGRRPAGSRTSTGAGRAAESPPGNGAAPPARPNAAESAPPEDVRELQQEIELTRERLGETVDQLVAKADVKARAKDTAAELADRVKGQAGQAKAQAAARAGTVRDQLAGHAVGARQKAADLGTTTKEQVSAGAAAAAAPVWEAAPEPARQAVVKGAAAARQHRVPLAVAAGVLVVGFVVIRWRRRR
jgi:Protein of unknown function (DUF3618)